jgi:ferric-dicitrate binding protein FerR (iron transport regulator)
MKKQMNMNDFVIEKSDLLSEFLSGTLTAKGKSDLYRYVADKSHKDEILAWLQEQWAKEHGQADGDVSSDEMFAKIRAEIENIGRQKLRIHQRAIIRNGKMLLRYAAVLLIAFGLSWALQRTMNKPDNMETALQYNEILVPYGSRTKVLLPDSSTVLLNAGAVLKYPANFNGMIRRVFLQGEGFFDVTKDSRHPFIVSSNGLDIKVLGTKFNVMANVGDHFIETTLVEGVIEILGLKDNVGKKSNMRLSQGQKLTLRKENEHYEVQSIQKVELSIAWTENKLVFVKERFGDMKPKLERWYGVTIEVKDAEILDYRFSGTFENQTLEQAMNALGMATSCTFQIDNNHVKVSK